MAETENGERRVKIGTGPLRCYLKYRKCFTKLSQQLHSNAADWAAWADLAEWLPHNRRQVKFIFLTNNMNFKDPVSHYPILPIFPHLHPLALPLCTAPFLLATCALPISFFALVAVSSDKEIEMLRASVCVCVPCMCSTYTSILCVWAWQS